MRILLVEDDRVLLRTLAIGLRAEGYDVLVAADGRTALDACRDDDPDLVILDLGLPDLSGFDVLRSVRTWSALPFIVLSARSDSVDKVTALDAGADDYVTKPFGMDELLARLRALVRRNAPDAVEEPAVTFGDAVVDLAAKRVTVGGAEVRLTPTEWHLLEVLVRHPGRLMSQHQLLTEVWGPGYETAQGNLRLYMAQLRRKLEPDPGRPRYFRNEPGMGYRFEPQAT